MNTKLLMTISAIFLGVIGLILTFFPKEVIVYINEETNVITTLVLQILGSLYLGFGMLNWMAKGIRIGGIYNKPVAIGNFMHSGIGAITLIKVVFGVQIHADIIISLTIIYCLFAISFAYVFMTNPSNSKKVE